MNEHIIGDMILVVRARCQWVGLSYRTKLDLPGEHAVMKLIPSGNVIQSIFLWQEE